MLLPHEQIAGTAGFGEAIMAIEPSMMRGFTSSYERRAVARAGSIATMRIEGPLGRTSGYAWDGYDSILQRYEEALKSDARGVLMVMHTPGGYVSGLDETVEKMLALKAQHGKPVWTVSADAQYSAGVYLGSVADKAYVVRSGGMGSVGTIVELWDFSKFNERFGLRVVPVTSGEQKADGHSEIPLTEEVIGRFQARVDFFSRLFFERVASARGMTIEQVRGQQAAIYLGEDAVKAGLADGVVSTVDEVVAMLEQQTSGRTIVALSGRAAQKGQNMELSKMALALGIAASATESEITERATALRDLESKLREVTGKASATESLAVVGAWKDCAGKLVEAQSELTKVRQAEEQRAYSAEVERARAEGKLVPANEAKVLSTYKTSGELAAWRETVVAAVPGAKNADEKQPENNGKGEKKEPAALTWRGKTWAQLSYSERADLAIENKALYAEMKGAA